MASAHDHADPLFRRLVAPLALILAIAAGTAAGAATAPVGLGTATSFAVLAGSTVTNTGPSLISGDVGVSPGTAVTGFPPAVVTNGVVHSADAVAAQAQSDVTIAYNDAAGRAPTGAITADLGGQTLVAGVYSGGDLALTGTLTLDGQGDPSSVFIFQASGTLITASGSRVALINGANACNVFWQVGSSATLFVGTTFVGSVLALASITAQTGTTVAGRLLARTGAVTLDTNTVTRPTCAAVTPTPSATPTGTPTATSSPAPSAGPTPTSSTAPTGTPTATSSPAPTAGPTGSTSPAPTDTPQPTTGGTPGPPDVTASPRPSDSAPTPSGPGTGGSTGPDQRGSGPTVLVRAGLSLIPTASLALLGVMLGGLMMLLAPPPRPEPGQKSR